MPKFGTKNVLFGYFGLEFENSIVIFEINTPNLSNCKILEKTKMRNLGPKMLDLRIWGWYLKILLSYLKYASSNLYLCRVWCKNKNLQVWDRKCLTWVFLSWNLKIFLSYLKSAFSNLHCCKVWCKNKNP